MQQDYGENRRKEKEKPLSGKNSVLKRDFSLCFAQNLQDVAPVATIDYALHWHFADGH